MEFTKEEKHCMLNLAEWAVSDFISTGKRKSRPPCFPEDGKLHTPMGVFVSVYVRDELRGCIGTFSESEPLIDNIQKMAVQAATEDRRFKALGAKDLDHMKVEISVLLPRKRIFGPDEIEIGTHGIYLIHGYRRATLLPQVALTNNWTPVEFLECCAENKLGLSKSSWKEAELYVYEAILID